MAPPSSLRDVLDRFDTSEKTLLLLNREGFAPLFDLLESAFEGQSVAVAERNVPEGTEDLVCLIDDREVVATSPFADLRDAYLLVNFDRYVTGTRPADGEGFPDVLTGLHDVEFTVAGYPESNDGKLLLIVVSRFVEWLALRTGAGELHSAFQRLARLGDEYGTLTMYERLADSGVETHVYGTDPEAAVLEDLDVEVHGGDTPDHRRGWVVVFSPDDAFGDGNEARAAALVAWETGKNRWRGAWTYDPGHVETVREYVVEEM